MLLIIVHEHLTSIEEKTFCNTELRKVVIPSCVTKIGPYAFNNCTEIVELFIPSSLTDIRKNAFENCLNLKTVTIERPSSLKLIDDHSFADCSTLINFEFPNSLEKVSETAFENCIAITQISLPASEGIFGLNNFETCISLTKAILHPKTEHISSFLFYGCSSLIDITT